MVEQSCAEVMCLGSTLVVVVGVGWDWIMNPRNQTSQDLILQVVKVPLKNFKQESRVIENFI